MNFFILFLGLGALQWLLAIWIKNRLEKSIQHEYDKKLEEFKYDKLKRQKAALIAEFFAKWIKYGDNSSKILTQKELFDYYEQLNKMSLEISIWIDDEALLKDIMKRLCNDAMAKDVRTLTTKVRTHVQGRPDEFESREIVLWHV